MNQSILKLCCLCLGATLLVSGLRVLHPATFAAAVPIWLGVGAAILGLFLLRHE